MPTNLKWPLPPIITTSVCAGSVALLLIGSAAPSPAQSAPRYINYPAGSGQANNAAEPSIGVDWNPNVAALKHEKVNTGGVAFFTSGPAQWRSNFDDCSSPAVNLWQNMNAPVVAGLDPIGFVDHFSSQELGLGPNPPRTPGRVFGLELAAGDSTAAFSDNDGGSWVAIVAGGLPAGPDHQSLGGGPFHAPLITPPPPAYPNAIYYCSHAVVEALCSRSDDGGLTFGPGVPIYNPVQCFGGNHGHVKVSPQGTVYVPSYSCGSTGAGAAVSKDNGITWNQASVPDSTSGQDPSIGIGMNSVGKPPGQVPNTVYLGWISGDGSAHIAHSPDEGVTWQDDTDISAILGLGNAVFPVVVAGDDNRAAFAFLAIWPSGGNIWHLYIATTYDGGRTYSLIDATPNDPVQKGGICLSGILGCGNDRNLLDFNDFTVDAEGRGLVAYADGCNNCNNTPGAQSVAARGVIARQSGGRRLFAAFDPVEPAVPAAPQLKSAIRNDVSTVTVSWLEPDNGGSPLTGYNVYRATSSGTKTFLANIPASNPRYVDTAAPNTSNWFYHVTAMNAIGEGTFCRELNVNGAQPVESACDYPYLSVQTDSSGDQAGGPSVNTQEDIQRVAVGEPFSVCADKSLTFLMKVQTLTPALPPGAAWTVSFKALDNTSTLRTLYVQMDTQTVGTGSFNYGYVDATAGKVNQCGKPNGPSPCPLTGSYLPDGTIVLKLDRSAPLKFFSVANTGATPDFTVDLGVGASLTVITGTTQLGSIQTVDTTTTGIGAYTVAGNLACTATLPVAQLTANPTSGTAPLAVNFDASASSVTSPCATLATYTLNFGDGSPAVTQASPFFSYTYNNAGTYPARLTVTDSAGQVSTNPAQVVISVSSIIDSSSVVSRKIHGGAGAFDINLPPTGTRGIECRTGGASNDYTLVFTFQNTLISVGSASITAGIGSVSSSAIGPGPHQYTVNLTGVTNGQYIMVTLSNVFDSTGAISNASRTMGILVGDTTADGFVNSADISQTKSKSGQAVDSTSFRQDATVDGFLNSADISLVKSKSGTALP